MHICWIEDSERLSHKLAAGETVIGRHPDCQIVIGNSQVSRRHAQITAASGTYTIIDLESMNGTYVTEFRASRSVIDHVARTGRSVFMVERLYSREAVRNRMTFTIRRLVE